MMNVINSNRQSSQLIKAILVCFFLSGTTALIYQILWIRMLGLIFGHTVYAVTTVLVVFMGGLGLGAYLCGRVVDRVQGLLRMYGILELGIGGYCLLIPWIMEGVKWTYLSLSRSLDLSHASFTMVQFLLVLIALLLPTTLMGATLPILSRFFVRDLDKVGEGVGRLYALNTFGAVFGTYLAGFQLLPVLGMKLTLLFAASLNIGIGFLIFRFDERLKLILGHESRLRAKPEASMVSERVGGLFRDNFQIKLVVAGFALSGAASMIYEIAWTRALSLVIGSSTYAYSSMLLSFLLGIAVGSAVFSRLTRKRPASFYWFSGIQLAIGLSAAAVLPLFEHLPEMVLRALTITKAYSFVLFLQVVVSSAVMFLPTFLIGATFPCVVMMVSRNLSRLGHDVGSVYAYNTIGAIVGSLLAGFILIPSIGVQASIEVAIVINLLIALVIGVFGSSHQIFRLVGGIGVFVVAFGVLNLPDWDRKLMSSGPSVYAGLYIDEMAGRSFDDILEEKAEVVYYKDGISSTVSVHKEYNSIHLRVNGKTDASNGGDMQTQLKAGHLPALIHPDPKTALVIGLASGVTVGALTQYDLDRIDVVELEPAMIEASAFFEKENRNALNDPRVNLIIGDGRNALMATTNKYDLIISEPSNPWIGGVATLFTQEFFDLIRKRLEPDGVVAVWIQGYGMAPEDVRMVAHTFLSIFSNATLWMPGQSDYLLIGSLQPVSLDLDRVRKAYYSPSFFREDMDRLKMLSPEAILGDFYLDADDLVRFTVGAELNTDDLLPLEFSAPRTLYVDTIGANLFELRKAKRSLFPILKAQELDRMAEPEVQYHLAMNYIQKMMPKEAMDHLNATLSKAPDHLEAHLERARLLTRYDGGLLGAMKDYEAAIHIDSESAVAHYELGRLYLRQGQKDKALEKFRRAVSIEPDNAVYLFNLAASYHREKRFRDAEIQYRLALENKPENSRIMGALAATLVDHKKPTDAVELLGRAIAISPKDHRLHYQLGQAYLLLGMKEKARDAFVHATRLNPADPEPYVGLGKAWLAMGDRPKAVGYFRKATSINPRIAIPEV